MFFGGSLVSVKGANETTTKRIQHEARVIPNEALTTVTPHTDALNRLTNHQYRLLEELERTRAKLQAEWRLKLTELQSEEPETAQALFQHGSPTVDQLTQFFLLPHGLEHSVDGNSCIKALNVSVQAKTTTNRQQVKTYLPGKKKGGSAKPPQVELTPPQLPRIRANLDILPILTTSGETPFEVGLDSNSLVPNPVLHAQQHVLPIFRLPDVNIHAAATALTTKEVEMLEEDRDKQDAMATLGLSLEEIEMMEAELSGKPLTRSHNSEQGSHAANLPRLTQPIPFKKARKQPIYGSRKKAKSVQQGRAREVRVENSNTLRDQLESALTNVQQLTRLVRSDITLAQKMCPASDLRTRLYFKRWGREKVEGIFRRLLYNLQGMAFERWKTLVMEEKQQEKLQAYLMYKGSKKLDEFLIRWTHRKLQQAWSKWASDVAHEKALERHKCELESIAIIQRAWRGYRARIFVNLIKLQKQSALETAAACSIQRAFRGWMARRLLWLKRDNKRRHRAAQQIQAFFRALIVRRIVKRMKRDKRQHLAAARIQAMYRGRTARRQVAKIRGEFKLCQAATIIQRRYRGRLGRVKYLKKQIERYRDSAAIKIQKLTRCHRARRIVRDRREAKRQVFILQTAAATNIQRVYRGHRSRLGTQLKLMALREKNKIRNEAAIKIQKVVRCRQARQIVERLRQERLISMIRMAKLYVEYWSEDRSQWFYYNMQTTEAIWAPPSTGYTKADGTLVLKSGKVMSDPGDDGAYADTSLAFRERAKHPIDLNTNTHDEEEDYTSDRLCVECEEADALRKCEQCQDVFCDACFTKLHSASSKREKHTWKAIGTMRCIECEKMKATRWCSICQDPYCLGCFTIIHSKGNKSSHPWEDMSQFNLKHKKKIVEEENDQTYHEFMQSNEYQYVAELESNYDGSTYAPSGSQSADPGSEWQTFYDDNSGQYYYYNSSTGETQWM